jgi:Cu-Zn family superoxide dismutase
LPPLLSAANGSALLSTYTDRFRPQDVIGRSVVIHSGPDDFSSQPAGNSGGRIACGVIEAFSPSQS